MKAVEIKKGIYWVGGVDWRLRNFHGYMTQRGSTYNAYLIIDEKITLIDTVKYHLYDEMLARISSVIDPNTIDIIISNHVEMDHTGSLRKMDAILKNAQIYASPKGVEGLNAHYGDMGVKEVRINEPLSIGERTLTFVPTPMVHWPDNMVTYCQEDKILFSNDSFGQHIASEERFDDEFAEEIVLEEAKKYYANIVLPYGNQVKRALDTVATLDIDMICPSHGLIWRKNIDTLIESYNRWAKNETKEKAVIVYDTMWESTSKLAISISEAFEKKNILAELICLQDTHISDVMTALIEAKYICLGSPTINSNILPTVGAFITYLKGLSPKKRIGLAFGSYGWGGQSSSIINSELSNCGFTMLDPIKCKYIPDAKTLSDITINLLEALGQTVLKNE